MLLQSSKRNLKSKINIKGESVNWLTGESINRLTD